MKGSKQVQQKLNFKQFDQIVDYYFNQKSTDPDIGCWAIQIESEVILTKSLLLKLWNSKDQSKRALAIKCLKQFSLSIYEIELMIIVEEEEQNLHNIYQELIRDQTITNDMLTIASSSENMNMLYIKYLIYNELRKNGNINHELDRELLMEYRQKYEYYPEFIRNLLVH